jgi:hypothetical protein
MFSVLKIIPTIHLSITLHKVFFMNIYGSTNNHWLEKVYFEDTENSSRQCKTVNSLTEINGLLITVTHRTRHPSYRLSLTVGDDSVFSLFDFMRVDTFRPEPGRDQA